MTQRPSIPPCLRVSVYGFEEKKSIPFRDWMECPPPRMGGGRYPPCRVRDLATAFPYSGILNVEFETAQDGPQIKSAVGLCGPRTAHQVAFARRGMGIPFASLRAGLPIEHLWHGHPAHDSSRARRPCHDAFAQSVPAPDPPGQKQKPSVAGGFKWAVIAFQGCPARTR